MFRRRVSSLLSVYCKPTFFISHHPLPPPLPPPYTHKLLLQAVQSYPNPNPNGFSFFTRDGSTRGYSLLALNDLRDCPGRKKNTKRVGRGIGSGKGKTCGRGHKGQKARGKVKPGFEGGQTPLRLRVPKRGFKNRFKLDFQPVGLGKIARLINAGKIDSHELINMKVLKDAGAAGKQIGDGVKLFGRGFDEIKWPIHIEVSRTTLMAKAAVEALGGSVRKVHYNKLAMRALLRPEWFDKKRRLLPRSARPPPKQWDKVDSVGRLPAPTKPIPFIPGEVKPPFPPPPPLPAVPRW